MSEGPLNSATARKTARYALLLSIIVALTGNAFLGFCGGLTGGLVLFFPRRSNATRDSADLIAGLSTVTACISAATAIIMLSSGLLILLSSPERFCYASTMIVQRLEQYNGTLTAAPGGRIVADSAGFDPTGGDGDGGAARRLERTGIAPRAFPMDGGTNATDAEVASAPSLHPVAQTAAAHTLYYLNMVKDIACGPFSEPALILGGLVVLAYGFLVLLPLSVCSMRLARLARLAGGCSFCAPPETIVVPPYSNANGRQAFNPNRDVVVAVPLQRGGATTITSPDGSVAVAVAVPVHPAAAAPRSQLAREMH